MTCHLSTKLDVHFVGFTMGDEPLIRFNGPCPWKVPSGEGSPRGGQGDDHLTKGGGGQTAAYPVTLASFGHPPPHPPPWLSAHRDD